MNRVLKFFFGKPPRPVTLTDSAYMEGCTNCGAEVTGAYCSHCGQKKMHPKDFKVSHFLEETVHAFTHFDSKFFKSFKYVALRPGFLTQEYILGHRKNYMNPIQLFLVVNVIYFLLTSSLNMGNTFTTPLKYQLVNLKGFHLSEMVDKKVKESGITYEEYEKEFNHKEQGQAKTLVVIMVPLFAMFLALVFWRQRRYFVEHLVFSLHFYCFVLIAFSLGMVGFFAILRLVGLLFNILGLSSALQIQGLLRSIDSDTPISLILGISLTVYLYIALKRIYKRSVAANFYISLLTTIVGFGFVLNLYRIILFYTTFYGLHLSLH